MNGKPLLRVLNGERIDPVPVWMMRQAGRHLPEYREVRARARDFLDFCYSPSLAAEATLQPVRRYQMDGAILFADILLVLDATVGQNGLTQAREFMNVAGVNGIVLTKLDGTAKGGVAVAIAHDLKLPIRYVGVGEGIDDLLPFKPAEYVGALFQEKW